MEKVNITIVGAGVIGLSIAYELSQSHKDVFVIEKNNSFGEEISSRNSEVIHAGLYYPKDSLKTKTCVEGRNLLYEFCNRNNIGHQRIGKLIVAIDDSEIKDLKDLYRQGLENGVSDLKMLSRNEAKAMEPNVECAQAIYSPSTGIIDSHGLMKSLAFQFQGRGGSIAYATQLSAVEKNKQGFLLTVDDKREGAFQFESRVLINCAGLNSDKVAAMAGLAKEEYRLKYCKGDYLRVHSSKAKMLGHLVYPVPKKDRAGLGIHATLDLAGSLRLGPDDEYVEKIDYNVAVEKIKVFCSDVSKFLPFIQEQDLSLDMAGIRPKLQGPGEGFRDFIIQDEARNGIPGLINLIGIESPGLTSCLSIARMVKNMFKIIT
jgi:L-2-hydroxyglutarate oxidase LhgO